MIYLYGSNGKVGTALREVLELNKAEYITLSLIDNDLYDPGSIVVNCLGYTDVEGAETDWLECKRINIDFVKSIAKKCLDTKSRLIHISSDYVFDGRKLFGYVENDETNPLNGYGISKRDSEKSVIESGCEHTIIRTSWLYGGIGKSFPITIIEKLREGVPFNVDCDITCTPTLVGDLVNFIFWENINHNSELRIRHYSGFFSVSLFAYANIIKNYSGLNCIINPVKHENNPTLAYRPKNTSLYTIYNFHARDFYEDIGTYIRSIT